MHFGGRSQHHLLRRRPPVQGRPGERQCQLSGNDNANYPGNDSVLNYAGNDAGDVADDTRQTYLLPIDAQIWTAGRAPRSAALQDATWRCSSIPALPSP
jgi:hypothetical protein